MTEKYTPETLQKLQEIFGQENVSLGEHLDEKVYLISQGGVDNVSPYEAPPLSNKLFIQTINDLISGDHVLGPEPCYSVETEHETSVAPTVVTTKTSQPPSPQEERAVIGIRDTIIEKDKLATLDQKTLKERLFTRAYKQEIQDIEEHAHHASRVKAVLKHITKVDWDYIIPPIQGDKIPANFMPAYVTKHDIPDKEKAFAALNAAFGENLATHSLNDTAEYKHKLCIQPLDKDATMSRYALNKRREIVSAFNGSSKSNSR